MGKPAEQLRCSKEYEFPKFRCVEPEDMEMITEYTKQYPVVSCEYSFANLYCWRELYRLSWSQYKGRLLVCDGVSDHVLMPVGEELLPSELVQLSHALREMGLSGDLDLVPPEYLEKYPEMRHHYSVSEHRDFADYIYSVQKLHELKGSKLHKKKNLISQFIRLYPDHAVKKISGEEKARCFALAERLLMGNLKISRSIREEHQALKVALRSFEQVGMEGLMLTVDGEPVAFSLFSPLNGSMYDIHFEKADFAFKGAAQMINFETAKYLSGRCDHINREQDLGLPGLRTAKLSYVPEWLYTTCHLEFKGE